MRALSLSLFSFSFLALFTSVFFFSRFDFFLLYRLSSFLAVLSSSLPVFFFSRCGFFSFASVLFFSRCFVFSFTSVFFFSRCL